MEDIQIAILIPHYNSPKDLLKSVMSIQERIKVDILIVDDGSTVKFDEKEIMEGYSAGQTNFLYLEENSGIGVALNTGMQFIIDKGYKYIGRLDSGDFCIENRFSIQVEYLNMNQDVALLGSWANILDEDGKLLYILRHPTDYSVIRKRMYLNNAFVHPSVVFRSKVVNSIGDYPYKYRFASQDYAFFFNIMKKHKVENLPMVLLDYIVASDSISTKKRKLQVKNRINIILDNFYFGFYPIYGLMRNLILYIFPRELTTFLKKRIQ